MNKKIAMPNEAIVGLMASHLDVTGRAIKSMKADNPSRYQREAIGTLLTSSGTRLEDILELFNENTNPLDIKELSRKAKLFDMILDESEKHLHSNDVAAKWNRDRSEFIRDTMRSIFSSFRSPENEGLEFEFYYPNLFSEDRVLADIPSTKLTVHKTAAYSNTQDEEVCDNAKEIEVMGSTGVDMSLKSVGEIFKEVKSLYPEMQPDKIKSHTYKIELEAVFKNENTPHDERGYEEIFQYIDIIHKDIKIRISDNTSSPSEVETMIQIGEFIFNLGEWNGIWSQRLQKMKEYLDNVVRDMALKSIYIDRVTQRIEKLLLDGDEEWIEEVAYSYCSSYLSIVLDHIYPGLYDATYFLSLHYDDIPYSTISTDEEWAQSDKEGLVWRKPLKLKGEAFPPHRMGGTPRDA